MEEGPSPAGEEGEQLLPAPGWRDDAQVGAEAEAEVNASAPTHEEETSSVASDSSGPLCRICLDSNAVDLIAPCKCRGSQKYVHRSCLDNWRSSKKGFAFAHCFDCRSCYKLRPNIPPDRARRKLNFLVAIILHHVILFFFVQMIVIFVAYISLHYFKHEIKDALGFMTDHYFNFTIVPLFIFMGLVYGYFIAIIFDQSIRDFHSNLIGQQDIAKEFVVEDLGDAIEEENLLSNLDDDHIRELKSLGLLVP